MGHVSHDVDPFVDVYSPFEHNSHSTVKFVDEYVPVLVVNDRSERGLRKRRGQ
jgi:hypothetical protein